MNELFWNDFWSNHGGTTGEFLDRASSDPLDGIFGRSEEECYEIASQAAQTGLATDEWCRQNLRLSLDEAAEAQALRHW